MQPAEVARQIGEIARQGLGGAHRLARIEAHA